MIILITSGCVWAGFDGGAPVMKFGFTNTRSPRETNRPSPSNWARHAATRSRTNAVSYDSHRVKATIEAAQLSLQGLRREMNENKISFNG